MNKDLTWEGYKKKARNQRSNFFIAMAIPMNAFLILWLLGIIP